MKSLALSFETMPRSTGGQSPDRDRIQANLPSEQGAEINRVRGKYLTDTGKDVQVTQVLRAAIDHFVKLNWTDVRNILAAENAPKSWGRLDRAGPAPHSNG
jgi:hypothetical protein